MMLRRCGALVVASLWAMASGPASTAASAGQAADPVAKSVAAMHADGGYQFSLPPPPPPPPPPPQWLIDLFKWFGGDGRILLYGLLGVFLVALAVLLLYMTVPVVREWIDDALGRLRPSPTPDEAGEWRPDALGARNLLAEADALAAAGRYGEAAHLLLGRSIEDIVNRRPGLIRPALSARAIAVMHELPAPARSTFGSIAVIVERAIWARRDVDLAGWQTARAAYEHFAFGDHWRAPMTAPMTAPITTNASSAIAPRAAA